MTKFPESIDPFDRDSANFFVRVEHLARYEYAAEFIRKRRLTTALDCACGSGYGVPALARHAKSVTATDRDENLLALGAARCREAGVTNAAFRQADLDHGLPFLEDNSFDCAVCFETVEHVQHDGLLLKELARVLRRGRWLLLSAPKEGYEPQDSSGMPENPWHLRLYTAESLIALVEQSGFAVESTMGQPTANMLRAQSESWRRDTGVPTRLLNECFVETPETMRYFARLFGWPATETPEKSSVLLLICRKL